jgi:hypothetical protein
MSEETNPPATPQQPEGSGNSQLNSAQLASLTKTEEICRTALKPDYLTALITLDEGEEPGEEHVTQTGIENVLAICDAARGKGSAAVNATGGRKQSTAEEAKAEKILIALIRNIQARARQKHFFKNPAILAEYGIGLHINDSRADLEGWAQTAYDKTATDKLPKVTEAKRADLKAALETYKATQTTQSGTTGEASGIRIDRDSLVEQATAGRMWIQFAADAEWPHTEPANHPVRKEFQLPAIRPFLG